MTLLEFFFIVAGVAIFITALDIANKRKFNGLHLFIFLLIGGALFTFSVYPQALQTFGNIFGVARGADVLVYISIILLFYFVLLLLKKNVDTSDSVTKIVREMAIENSSRKIVKGKVAFVVRVYNEAPVLKKVLQKIFSAGYENIIVINDGSTDGSKQILERFEDKIILLNHAFNRGGGAALETGFEYLRRYGRCEYLITFDADDQHDINQAKDFIKKLDKEHEIEIVFGSRFVKGGSANVPMARKIILFGGKIFTAIVSGVYLTDSHNGYRALRLETLQKIHLSVDGMAYASELTEEIGRNKIIYGEIPVTIKYTDYSLQKGQKSSNAISIALRTLWNKFFR